MIRDNSLVQLDTTQMTDADSMKYPSAFHDGSMLAFVGEIPNMPGHGIFVSKNHHFVGYKISMFAEVSQATAMGIKAVK